MEGAVHDLRSVRRPPRATVVAQGVSELFHVGSVCVHSVDVEVAVLERCKHDPLAIGRKDAFGGVDAVPGETLEVRSVGIGGVYVVWIQAPDVPFGRIGARRARGIYRAAGREEDAPIAIHEIATGRFSLAVRYPVNAGAIGVHDVLLVARPSVARTLENEPLAVSAEIGFCVLATIRELPDVDEMPLFTRVGGDGMCDERSLGGSGGGKCDGYESCRERRQATAEL